MFIIVGSLALWCFLYTSPLGRWIKAAFVWLSERLKGHTSKVDPQLLGVQHPHGSSGWVTKSAKLLKEGGALAPSLVPLLLGGDRTEQTTLQFRTNVASKINRLEQTTNTLQTELSQLRDEMNAKSKATQQLLMKVLALPALSQRDRAAAY